MKNKVQHDGWSSAMAPIFISAQAREKHVSFAEKVREGAELRAAVERHIAKGGEYQVLSARPFTGILA